MSKMLSSWKEIAHFFGKGVRTVQRWEKTLALPIHRPPGAPSNVVLARTSDLEEWMHRGSVARAVVEEEHGTPISSEAQVELAQMESEVNDLMAWAGISAEVGVVVPTVEARIIAAAASLKQIRLLLSSPERNSRAA